MQLIPLIVDEIGLYIENGDPLVNALGIGGKEYFFRKSVDFIRLGSHKIPEMKLDFGILDGWDINGLIGLDILMNGKFIIDLEEFELVQNQ